MFGSLGLPELLILLAIVVLIFGVNKLPKLGKGIVTCFIELLEHLRCVRPVRH